VLQGDKMSQTFSIVCHETKRRVWVGQGWGKMQALYSDDKEAMANLRAFLNDHIGRPLEFVCDDRQSDDVASYEQH
jgi:hypothetical protein